jgi:hypothetical protein
MLTWSFIYLPHARSLVPKSVVKKNETVFSRHFMNDGYKNSKNRMGNSSGVL